MNLMNLKFGDVIERRSPTFSDCHFVKEIPFSFDYCILSNFTYFLCIIECILSFVKIVS